MSKDAFIQDVQGTMSQALLEKQDAVFGTVEPLTMPNTVDDAIIAIGKANVAFTNAILVPLSGLPIVELILKNGQQNEVSMGLLLSALEMTATVAGISLYVVFPAPDLIYLYEAEGMLLVCGVDGDQSLIGSITAEFQGGMYPLTVSPDDSTQYGVKAPIAIPDGADIWEETATFTLQRTDEEPVQPVSVTFQISMTAYPPEEGGGGASGGAGASSGW